MTEEQELELEALRTRANDVAYLMIEAEGDEYFNYAEELEDLELEIDEKELELSDLADLFNNKGIM